MGKPQRAPFPWMDDLKSFRNCCEAVLRNSKDPSARVYAMAGIVHCFTISEVTTQCLYILTNLGGWKGEEARSTKAELRRISKTKVFKEK